jgi:ankyrin repeat protein
MLRVTNEDGDTALHMAVRNPDVGVCLKVVEVLIREDPEFQHPANSAKETPLYLAAKGRNTAVVYVLLEGCQMPSYSGPCDSTALHAAALEDSTGLLTVS